jgi:hypothetical protein
VTENRDVLPSRRGRWLSWDGWVRTYEALDHGQRQLRFVLGLAVCLGISAATGSTIAPFVGFGLVVVVVCLVDWRSASRSHPSLVGSDRLGSWLAEMQVRHPVVGTLMMAAGVGVISGMEPVMRSVRPPSAVAVSIWAGSGFVLGGLVACTRVLKLHRGGSN